MFTGIFYYRDTFNFYIANHAFLSNDIRSGHTDCVLKSVPIDQYAQWYFSYLDNEANTSDFAWCTTIQTTEGTHISQEKLVIVKLQNVILLSEGK